MENDGGCEGWKVKVPSDSSIPLSYSAHGEAPILAVRLQELFGMLQTPSVNQGAVNVVIHLLSPGYKPVQVTTDLRSFWQNTWFDSAKNSSAATPNIHGPKTRSKPRR